MGVSPAVGGSAVCVRENIDENKLKRKLEMSIQNEKALSQRFDSVCAFCWYKLITQRIWYTVLRVPVFKLSLVSLVQF